MNIVAIVQARMNSSRLPGKVMMKINQVPLIEILTSRLKNSRHINKIIVATSDNKVNQPLIKHLKKIGLDCFIGSESDVLRRYNDAANVFNADVIVRITGDCPLIDPSIVDTVIDKFISSGADYASNREPPTFPDGLDVEVISRKTLNIAQKKASKLYDREHVTPFIIRSTLFKKFYYKSKQDFSSERWTVDEIEDFRLIEKIFSIKNYNFLISWEEVLELKDAEPDLFDINKGLIRNEGSIMGTGQKLWRRAKKIIPGGNMLLSKRSEMFLPNLWPSYYSKAKGCRIWDLDGREFVDMTIMGVGTNILGYGNEEVDEAVKEIVAKGNMSTLNCPEELYLAEKLIELHPWADMVKFARSGGEANSVAIRIARAASGRDKVAICGYHGWHDWYLSANLSGSNLDNHLLPGLNPLGVPKNLRDSVFTFEYNQIDQLKEIITRHEIGVIKMEVSRNFKPKDNFLQDVRRIATEKNIVLIFDECTSGFRQTNGGLHKLYGVNPDIAIFGKALGNGYAITAVIGKKEFMDFAQSTFISSTFWTERIGPTAALKTLEIMNNLKSWDIITEKGISIEKEWTRIAVKHNLDIAINGLPSMIDFRLNYPNWLKYKTYITQEMLENGYLSSNAVYFCTEHNDEIIKDYLLLLDQIFEKIALCENNELNIDKLLRGPVCHSGFKRLN